MLYEGFIWCMLSVTKYVPYPAPRIISASVTWSLGIGSHPCRMMSSPLGGFQSLKGQVRLPVCIALLAQIVGIDSGYDWVKRRLSFARASRLGLWIVSLP